MSRLLKKGSTILHEKCQKRIVTFPPTEEILNTIDLCTDELRSLTGFWKGKGMSIAAT